jgi:hypothetical protein
MPARVHAVFFVVGIALVCLPTILRRDVNGSYVSTQFSILTSVEYREALMTLMILSLTFLIDVVLNVNRVLLHDEWSLLTTRACAAALFFSVSLYLRADSISGLPSLEVALSLISCARWMWVCLGFRSLYSIDATIWTHRRSLVMKALAVTWITLSTFTTMEEDMFSLAGVRKAFAYMYLIALGGNSILWAHSVSIKSMKQGLVTIRDVSGGLYICVLVSGAVIEAALEDDVFLSASQYNFLSKYFAVNLYSFVAMIMVAVSLSSHLTGADVAAAKVPLLILRKLMSQEFSDSFLSCEHVHRT